MKINIKSYFIILGFLLSTSFNFGAESIFRPATRIIPGHEGRPNAEDYATGFNAVLCLGVMYSFYKYYKRTNKIKKSEKEFARERDRIYEMARMSGYTLRVPMLQSRL